MRTQTINPNNLMLPLPFITSLNGVSAKLEMSIEEEGMLLLLPQYSYSACRVVLTVSPGEGKAINLNPTPTRGKQVERDYLMIVKIIFKEIILWIISY